MLCKKADGPAQTAQLLDLETRLSRVLHGTPSDTISHHGIPFTAIDWPYLSVIPFGLKGRVGDAIADIPFLLYQLRRETEELGNAGDEPVIRVRYKRCNRHQANRQRHQQATQVDMTHLHAS
jgi:hypothetical protein